MLSKKQKWFAGFLSWPPEKIANISQNIALIFVGIVLAWIAVQAFYTVPSVDDFCYGNRGLHGGAIATVIDEYFGWGGRYTDIFIITEFGSHPTLLLHYYFICPFTILVANFFASRHFLKKTGVVCCRFTFIFFVLLVSSYSLRQTLFWLSGSITYGLSNALFITLVGEVFALFSEGAAHAKGRIVILSAAAFILAGFNETIMIAHVVLLLCLLYGCFMRDHKINRPLATILILAMIGAIIVYLAPGNSIRSEHFPHPYIIVAAIKSFFWVFWRYGIFYLPTVIIFYCALALFSPEMKKTPPYFTAIYLHLSLFVALWASAFARFFTKSSSGPDRTRTVDYAIVTLLSFMTALYLYQKRKDDIRSALATLQGIKLLPHAYILLVGTFLTFNLRPVMDPLVIKTALHDIQYAASLKKYMRERFEIVTTNPKGELLQLPDFPEKTQALTYFDDITENPDDWRNVCFASYNGLSKVALRK